MCCRLFSDWLVFVSWYKYGIEDWSNYCIYSLVERFVVCGVGGWYEINYIW